MQYDLKTVSFNTSPQRTEMFILFSSISAEASDPSGEIIVPTSPKAPHSKIFASAQPAALTFDEVMGPDKSISCTSIFGDTELMASAIPGVIATLIIPSPFLFTPPAIGGLLGPR